MATKINKRPLNELLEETPVAPVVEQPVEALAPVALPAVGIVIIDY